MSQRAEEHYCRTCRCALDRVSTDPTTRSAPQFVHTVSADIHGFPPHDPDPAPLREFTHINAICDICSGPQVAFRYTMVDVTQVTIVDGSRLTNNFGSEWAICHDCDRIIQRRSLSALLDRAVDSITALNPGVHRVNARRQIKPVYQKLLGNPYTRTEIDVTRL